MQALSQQITNQPLLRPNLAEMIRPGPISGPCNYIKGNMTVTIIRWTARTNFMQTGTLGHSNNLSGATDRLTIKIYKWFWRILNFSLDRVWAGVVFVRLIYVIMHRFSLTKKKKPKQKHHPTLISNDSQFLNIFSLLSSCSFDSTANSQHSDIIKMMLKNMDIEK